MVLAFCATFSSCISMRDSFINSGLFGQKKQEQTSIYNKSGEKKKERYQY